MKVGSVKKYGIVKTYDKICSVDAKRIRLTTVMGYYAVQPPDRIDEHNLVLMKC